MALILMVLISVLLMLSLLILVLFCTCAVDIDIDHLGNQVDPGDAQAADHNQHHHKATAYENIPVLVKMHDNWKNLGIFDITRGRPGDGALDQQVFWSEYRRTGGEAKVNSKAFSDQNIWLLLWHYPASPQKPFCQTKTATRQRQRQRQRGISTCPKTPTVRLATKRPSRWVNKLRLIGRIDEKNFLVLRIDWLIDW